MRRFLSIITVCFMIMAMFSGCTLMQKLGFGDSENDELQPVSSIVMSESEAQKLTGKVPIRLYFANEDNTRLKLEVRYMPTSEAAKSVNNLATVIVNELIKGPTNGTGLKATIPGGTKLAARVKIDGSTAIVNFSKEFVDKHPGGKEAERLTIYSVVNSLTELKEIQKVRFLINGAPQKEFKGNFQFDATFPRTMSLLSHEATPSKAPDAGKPQAEAEDKQKDGAGADKDTVGDVAVPDEEDAATGGYDSIGETWEETGGDILE